MLLFFFDNNSGNSIQNNHSFCYILSGRSSRGSSHMVHDNGWRCNVAAFSARVMVRPDWLNQTDVYYQPMGAK
jgi:hypothetical protein